MSIFTTLNEIREYSPCSAGWAKLLKSLDKTHADDEPLALEHILDSNGLADALWALRVVKGHDKALRLFACGCARLALPIFEKQYPDDDRPRKAIEAAEAYALGRIGKDGLAKAAADAADAANAAARAAYVAPGVANAAACATNAAADAADAAYAAANAAYAAARVAARAKIEKLFLGMCRGEGMQS